MNFEEAVGWLEKSPHIVGCTNQYADAACSCGKKDALQAMTLSGAPECDGECGASEELEDLKSALRELI